MPKTIVCPYCLKKHSPDIVDQYYMCNNKIIPKDYVEKDFPKASVGLVGFSGHGKTVYLTAFFYLLQTLGREEIWNKFSWECQNEQTLYQMNTFVSNFQNYNLPKSTPENFPEPALIKFNNIPKIGSCFLRFYDTAGAVFEDPEKIRNTGIFVATSDILLFILSINDCNNDWINQIENLLNKYIIGVHNNLKYNLKNQHLIVIFSKADLLIDNKKLFEKPLSPEIIKFLNDGSYKWWNLEDTTINSKIKYLLKISEEIENWLKENKCKMFVTLAREYFQSVDYTIISSTGSNTIGNKTITKIKPEDPKRVLDPFMLIVEKIRPKSLLEKIEKKLIYG